MGLDMYAYKVPKKFAKGEFEIDITFFESKEGDRDFAYWRKHHDLHGWFEQLYRKKGGEEIVFNCVPVRLTLEDLDELEIAIKKRELPHTEGFFFGYFPPDDESDKYDLDFVDRAREAINGGYEVYYDSWW